MTSALSLTTVLERAALLHPESTVIDAGPATSSSIAIGEFAATVSRFALGMESLGIARTARVATLMGNHWRHLTTMLATMAMGATSHPMNPRMPETHLAHVFDEAQDVGVALDADHVRSVAQVLGSAQALRHVIVHGDVSEARSLLPARVSVHRWDDLLLGSSTAASSRPDLGLPALLSHTGGTSGYPKGVLHSDRQLLENALAFSLPDALGISRRDILFPAVPLCHAFGWGLPIAALVTGASLVLDGGRTDAAFTADILSRHGVTLAAGVPTVWERVRALPPSESWPPAYPSRVVIGGAAPSDALLRWFKDARVDILHCWGMTETAPFATVGRVSAVEQPGTPSAGRAIAGVELRIVDPAGATLGHDARSVGELEVRGPWIATAYLGGPKRPGSEWLRTGDLVRIDPRGSIYVVDRAKDVIKSGGEWISSLELEAALLSIEGVIEAAVVAVSHPVWGERPLAQVVVDDSRISAGALRRGLAAKVPRWWVPDRIDIVDQVPRTALGKLDKRMMRERIHE